MKFKHIFKEASDRINAIRNKPDVLLSTGLDDLDAAMGGGIGQGEVVVVAARPSHGKSSLLLNMMLQMADDGCPCMLVSEEMRADMLAERLVYMSTTIPKSLWGERSDDVIEDVANFWGGSRRPLLIAEHCGDIEKVCQAIREAKDNHGVKVAAVDYLQLVRGRGSGRYEQVTSVSVALKQCAVECGVTLLLAAQLGRGMDKRGDMTPRYSDLRESGQIEQDADVILFGVWPIKDDPEYAGSDLLPFSAEQEYRVFVGKNRNRGIRKALVGVGFDASRQTFYDAPAESLPNYETAFDEF